MQLAVKYVFQTILQGSHFDTTQREAFKGEQETALTILQSSC